MNNLPSDIEASYDSVAEQFVKEFFSELERKPFDRELLESFAKRVGGVEGQVCDIGCGPGQIARYLRDHGVNMRGIDLSHEMVKQARRLNLDISFERGDMLSLRISRNEGSFKRRHEGVDAHGARPRPRLAGQKRGCREGHC